MNANDEDVVPPLVSTKVQIPVEVTTRLRILNALTAVSEYCVVCSILFIAMNPIASILFSISPIIIGGILGIIMSFLRVNYHNLSSAVNTAVSFIGLSCLTVLNIIMTTKRKLDVFPYEVWLLFGIGTIGWTMSLVGQTPEKNYIDFTTSVVTVCALSCVLLTINWLSISIQTLNLLYMIFAISTLILLFCNSIRVPNHPKHIEEQEMQDLGTHAKVVEVRKGEIQAHQSIGKVLIQNIQRSANLMF